MQDPLPTIIFSLPCIEDWLFGDALAVATQTLSRVWTSEGHIPHGLLGACLSNDRNAGTRRESPIAGVQRPNQVDQCGGVGGGAFQPDCQRQ